MYLLGYLMETKQMILNGKRQKRRGEGIKRRERRRKRHGKFKKHSM